MSKNTGPVWAVAPVLLALAIPFGLIGLEKAGVNLFVNKVDHHYDPAVAAELNKNNCHTYSARTDEALYQVDCSRPAPQGPFTYTQPKRFGWQPSPEFRYTLPQ